MTDRELPVYEQLRRRSILLAWSWAFCECCRLTFAAVTVLGPCVILVFTVSAEAQRSAGHAFRMFGEWRLYAFLLFAGGLSFCLWKLAERGSRRLLRILGGDVS